MNEVVQIGISCMIKVLHQNFTPHLGHTMHCFQAKALSQKKKRRVKVPLKLVAQ